MNSLLESLRSHLFHALFVPAIALSGLALPALAGDVLYATGGCGLYTVDTTTGAATQVWCFPGVAMYAGGLAYDAATDKLFAIGALDSSSGTTRLFSIDRFTGVLTSYPGMSSNVNLTSGGLAIDPLSGVMYATGGNGFQSTALFTIDKNTGAATLIGQNGGQCCVAPFGFNMNGLGFRDNGTLYANGFTLSGMSVPDYSHLFTIDLASGLASDIGTHGVSVGRLLAYSGLAFASSGTLYSMGSISSSQNGLYTVDPATGLATLVGDLVLPLGCDGGLTFAPDGMPSAYCTAKINSQGCLPVMSFSGAPSATNPAPFMITATNVLNQKPGLLLYGYSQASTPFQGGVLCIASPLRRITTTGSHGSPVPIADCSGSYSIDFNLRIQSGLDPLLTPGQEVDTQYWSRDPASPAPVGLTAALSFQIGA